MGTESPNTKRIFSTALLWIFWLDFDGYDRAIYVDRDRVLNNNGGMFPEVEKILQRGGKHCLNDALHNVPFTQKLLMLLKYTLKCDSV